jgi:DNA-binding NtrC family response regulator
LVHFGKVKVKILPLENAVSTKPSRGTSFGSLVGEDRRMREMFTLLSDVAPTDATVVLEGETGTGKELVAGALHHHSLRAQGPFVIFDCSAVPRDLVESYLFGHVKGAFTGATSTRQGAFRRANGGTIFLDEIGELPLDLQPKLLRAIESRTVQMVGSDKYERVDVRVLAATNRNLKQEVREGRFREDLYYRLAVVRIAMPALRERPGDIPILVEHFIALAKARGDAVPGQPMVDAAGYHALQRHGWPGNVRELKNLVDRAVSLHRGLEPMDLSDFLPSGTDEDEMSPTSPAATTQSGGQAGEMNLAVAQALTESPRTAFKEAKARVVEAFERLYLTQLIDAAEGNISRAAHDAQMDRKHLRELLKKYGLWEK